MSDRDKWGLNRPDRGLATAASPEADEGLSHLGKTLEVLAAPRFSPYLSSLIFTIFLIIHLWASLTSIDAPTTVEINDKVSHYLAFSWLGAILAWSLVNCSLRWPQRIHLQNTWPWAALALFLYGFAIEGLQDVIPQRQFEWLDLAANGAGIATVLILGFFTKLRLARGKRRQEKREARL